MTMITTMARGSDGCGERVEDGCGVMIELKTEKFIVVFCHLITYNLLNNKKDNKK